MHVIIVGCGRVGSTLALELSESGHDVVVIDRNANAFRRLGDNFKGRTLKGIGFDRSLLTEAGISPQSAVIAVTSGDNSNILAARVAREMYRVERVVARIYDPRRASVYERLGVATVATVAWTSSRIMRTILPIEGVSDWTDPTSTYQLVERRISPAMAGTSVANSGANVALLIRYGKAEVPNTATILQEGDTVHLLATSDDIAAFDSHLNGTKAAH